MHAAIYSYKCKYRLYTNQVAISYKILYAPIDIAFSNTALMHG